MGQDAFDTAFDLLHSTYSIYCYFCICFGTYFRLKANYKWAHREIVLSTYSELRRTPQTPWCGRWTFRVFPSPRIPRRGGVRIVFQIRVQGTRSQPGRARSTSIQARSSNRNRGNLKFELKALHTL